MQPAGGAMFTTTMKEFYQTNGYLVAKSLFTIVLNETGGNQLKASKILGINRNTLRSKVKEYKIRMS